MARINNLTNFLTDVATAIRTKKDSETTIAAEDFDTEILSLPSQGVYQDKSMNITTNGNYRISPDTNYDAMTSVDISVAISPNLQDVTLTQNGTYTAGQGYDGIGQVIVDVPAESTILNVKDGEVNNTTLIVNSDDIYKELYYIKSTGTQYIDTGVIGTGDTRVEMVFANYDNSPASFIFGCRESTAIDTFCVYLSNYNNNALIRSDYDTYSGGTINLNNIVGMFYLDKNKNITTVKELIDNSTKTDIRDYSDFVGSLNIYIFCKNHNGEAQTFSNYMLFYFKIYDDGTLVRDFIPVKRKSDNEVGLYDKVTKQFFTNRGTGSFVAGPEID